MRTKLAVVLLVASTGVTVQAPPASATLPPGFSTTCNSYLMTEEAGSSNTLFGPQLSDDGRVLTWRAANDALVFKDLDTEAIGRWPGNELAQLSGNGEVLVSIHNRFFSRADLLTGEIETIDVANFPIHRAARTNFDGTVTAIESSATALPEGDHQGLSRNVFLWDGGSQFENITNATVFEAYKHPDISADGNIVVFHKEPADGSPVPTPSSPHLWTRATGEVVKLGDDGINVRISSDGSTVAWESTTGIVIRDLATSDDTIIPGPTDRFGNATISLTPNGSVAIIGFGPEPELEPESGFPLISGNRLVRWDRATGSVRPITDRLTSMELLQEVAITPDGTTIFASGNIARLDPLERVFPDIIRLDFLGGGPLAEAATIDDLIRSTDYCQDRDAPVVRLYRAFFDREPDVDGVRYWLEQSRLPEVELDDIAGFFTIQEEFANSYAGTTNEEYLTQVYRNVLGRDFDQAGFDYWLGLLNDGSLDRGGLVRWITANEEFIARYPFGAGVG